MDRKNGGKKDIIILLKNTSDDNLGSLTNISLKRVLDKETQQMKSRLLVVGGYIHSL